MAKVLIVLKRRHDYNPIAHSPRGLSTGLYNSASFIEEMLKNNGISAKLEVAIDNNCIDRMVNQYKPTHVILEALWVVPSKFAVLTKLHPQVKWIVRLHSEMPFMAGEGMALDWIADYLRFPNVDIGVNAPRMLTEVKTYVSTVHSWSQATADSRVHYLPNYYPTDYTTKQYNRNKYWIDIGCFGAVRPLKNHLLQAVAALDFAKATNKQLRFHINGGRIEMKGDPVMHNLRGLFQQLADAGHQMIIHEWVPREGFLELCSQMDLGLQVTFSETFNIVAADLISQGVPVVTSAEIPWASRLFNARAEDSSQISNKLLLSHLVPQLNVKRNQYKLKQYCLNTVAVWDKFFKEQ